MISFLKVNDLGDQNEDEETCSLCGRCREMHTHLGGELEGKK
jgi:hypothetical protein